MKAFLAVACAWGAVGCATAGGPTLAPEANWSHLPGEWGPSLVVGEARVVSARVNPMEMPRESSPARVPVDGGRFVLLWTRGTMEQGHRVLAQELAANGTPRGEPVTISSPDVDVVGAPRAISTDGRHVTASFVAASERGFALMAVPLDARAAQDGVGRLAGR